MAEVVKPEPTVFPEPEQFDLTSYPCPRCGTTMSAESYGPCASCVAQLQANQRIDASDDSGDAAAFEPKMNVTPNAVALKDD